MSKARSNTTPPGPAEPAWDVAHLFPAQGTWSEEEYLALGGNRLVEFTQGHIEVLTPPTMAHQLIVAFLYRAVLEFVSPRDLGTVLFAPLRVRLWPGKFREPDIVFLFRKHKSRMGNDYWEGADLVMEVPSDDDRRRDLDTKHREYAEAGIPEYWIVDPRERRISVLKLSGKQYVEHGVFGQGETAVSAVLSTFAVDVEHVFAAAAEAGV